MLQFLMLVFGVLVMPGAILLALRGWSEGVLSCGQAAATGVLAIVFITLSITPGGMPLALLLLLVSVLGVGVSLATRGSGRRTLKRLRQEDRARCERVLARDPRNAAAYARLGQLYEEEGRLREAMDAYREAVHLDPAQGAVRNRYQYLEERQALAESHQTKCPGCYTIQPNHEGICWKCGRTLDARLALLSRFRRIGRLGQASAIVLVSSLSVLFMGGVTRDATGATAILRACLIISSFIFAIASGIVFAVLYRRLLDQEEWERES